jgi:Protein kinase domain
MTPDEQTQVRTVLDDAARLPAGDRRAYVEVSTAAGSALRQEVLALLARLEGVETPTSSSADPGRSPIDGDRFVSDLQLGNYRLLSELGGGGMGVVYLAVRNDDVFHKTVAVKIIREGIVQREFVERFRRERQILAGLDHPNIARILDGGDTGDGRPFYVMEYVAGLPLDDHCRRFNADVESRLRLMLQVCGAVEYLHEHAIVHRDLKPGNILVTTDGRAKVLDFGIAGVQTPEGLLGAPGAAGGTLLLTPGFASPEQIEGSAASKGSDVYSLGVVLYHLLTGRLPFVKGTGEPDMARQLSEHDPMAPSAAAAARATTGTAITADLDRVVLNALRRDPTRRYASVRALREDLERILEGRPVTAHAPTWSYRTGKAVRRNKVATALAGSLLLASASASCFAIQWRVNQARLEVKEADFDKILRALDSEVDHWSDPARKVTIAEQTGVVKRAAGVLEDARLRKVAAQGDRPQLVDHVVTGVERVLTRAEQMAGDAPDVHKDVSVAYRKAGDFRRVIATTSGGPKEAAVRSYEHAADAARVVSKSDLAWARAALEGLAASLEALGARLNVPDYLQPVEPPVEVARNTPPAPRPLARPAAPKSVDAELAAELTQQLRSLKTAAQRAHGGAIALNNSLEGRGQSVRSNVTSDLAQVDMLLDQAGDDLTAGELAAAKQKLSSASFMLKRVKGQIGS